jgi:hypothetical protein
MKRGPGAPTKMERAKAAAKADPTQSVLSFSGSSIRLSVGGSLRPVSIVASGRAHVVVNLASAAAGAPEPAPAAATAAARRSGQGDDAASVGEDELIKGHALRSLMILLTVTQPPLILQHMQWIHFTPGRT